MEIINSINDLYRMLEIWEIRLQAYEEEKKAIEKLGKFGGPKEIGAVDYSQPRVSGGGGQLDFGETLSLLHRIENHISIHEDNIKNIKKKIKNIEDKVNEFEGIDYKVVYYRDIKGMTLQQIADKLNYSKRHIARISSRNKKII